MRVRRLALFLEFFYISIIICYIFKEDYSIAVGKSELSSMYHDRGKKERHKQKQNIDGPTN